MARRFHPRSSPMESLRLFLGSIPWKLLLLLPVIILVAIPAFEYGTHIGNKILPSATNFFYELSNPALLSPTPTPLPPFPTALPQVGPLLYTVQEADSCDEILTVQMRMADASQIFSDANPKTVKALNAAVGQNCGDLQPGEVMRLWPQYPLVALGGVVLKISATSPQQVLPTPLINVPQQPHFIDCSGGCLLTVRVTPEVQVKLRVETTLSIQVGSWVWVQAMMARSTIKGFGNYPYADPAASLDGMTLPVCDFQVDNTHDDNSLSCDQLTPNTIDDDGGAWLLGVTGPSGLGHWRYPLHLPSGTRVMLWLTSVNGNLKFERGNPVYRYDEESHLYVKV